MAHHSIFITGGSGYIGSHLIPELLLRGHEVRALVRKGSEGKIPPGCRLAVGDALNAASYGMKIPPADTLVHLVGVPHPNPSQAEQFKSVDLVSVQQAVRAAMESHIRHFIYLSVAHPAPVMKAYIVARMEGEKAIRQSGIPATFLRPFYVLGPGHKWPIMLLPAYWLFERFPSQRESAVRLGLVRIEQMIGALIRAIEDPPKDVRVVEVPQIRAATLKERSALLR